MTALSIIDDDVFTALAALINDVLPALGVVNVQQGQQNRTPMPPGPNFAIMTPADRVQLSANARDYDTSTGKRLIGRSVQVGVAVNFYGANATDNGQIFSQLFRDPYGCDFLRPFHVQPLWCDDGRQMPLTDSEKQYATRWMIHTWLQINPTVSTSQAFADTVTVNQKKVD
jgi:hypothetical protein